MARIRALLFFWHFGTDPDAVLSTSDQMPTRQQKSPIRRLGFLSSKPKALKGYDWGG